MEIGTGFSLTGTGLTIVFSFQSPLWLILLIIIPLIRWLHQFRRQSGTIPSTTVFLWKRVHHYTQSEHSISKPDPKWLLRAFIAVLIILTLSGPSLENKGMHSIDVWLDDSLSMFTQENKQNRMQIAIEQLHHYLVDNNPTQVQLHSLGKPALTLKLDSQNQSGWMTQLTDWTSKPRGEPSPPPSAILSPIHDHILITDGADTHLNQWLKTVPLKHVIQVGQSENNIALTLLSLRQSLNQSNTISGIIRLNNLSDTVQTVNYMIQREVDNQETHIIKSQMIAIPASGKVIQSFTSEEGMPEQLRASFESSSDALSLDNELVLKTDKQRNAINYTLSGQCSEYVLAVLDSQPYLVHSTTAPDIMISCNELFDESTLPVLRLHSALKMQQTKRAAHWHTNDENNMNSLSLPAGLFYSDLAPLLNADSTPLLSADKRILINHRSARSQRIDVYLDSSDPALTRLPEFPLLLLGLIRYLTGDKAYTVPLSSSRDSEASHIRPTPISITPVQQSITQSEKTSFSHLLVFTSLLLMVLDAALTFGLFSRFTDRT